MSEPNPPKKRGRYVKHLQGMRGDDHPRSRAVITPRGRFGSIALAAEAYGINPQQGSRLARKQLKGWRFE